MTRALASCILWLLALASWVGATPRAQEFGTLEAHLDGLRAEQASTREEAQRGLANDLEEEHYPRLAEAIAGGDAEFRRRVAGALAGRDRHLGLCLLLTQDESPQVAAVGKEGALELARRFLGSADEQTLTLRDLDETWRNVSWQPFALLPAGPLDALARLSELSGDGLPIVIEPRLLVQFEGAETPRGWPRRIEGTPPELLTGLCSVERWVAEVHGFHATGTQRLDRTGVPWVRVSQRTDGGLNAAQALVRFAQDAAGEGPLAEAAGRALGVIGWPAALQWCEGRARTTSSPAALEALVEAANRGRVSEVLRMRPVLLDLRRRAEESAERALQRGERSAAARAERMAYAAGATGLYSATGYDLIELFLPEPGTGMSSMWVRLAALESSNRAVRAEVRPLLTQWSTLTPWSTEESKASSYSLRYQALRTFANSPSEEGDETLDLGSASDAGTLFAWADERGLGEHFVQLAARSGWRLDQETGRPDDRAARILWALLSEDLPTAKAELAAELEGRPERALEWALRLRPVVALDGPAGVRALLEGLEPAAREVLAVRLGLASGAERKSLCTRALVRQDPSGTDLWELGLAAGTEGPAGERAVLRLLALWKELRGTSRDPEFDHEKLKGALRASELAAEGLFARQQEEQASELLTVARRALLVILQAQRRVGSAIEDDGLLHWTGLPQAAPQALWESKPRLNPLSIR